MRRQTTSKEDKYQHRYGKKPQEKRYLATCTEKRTRIFEETDESVKQIKLIQPRVKLKAFL